MQQRYYIAIDLKSFYASVECVERGLNPLDTCLVVADASRTSKTIVLAVSPALKSLAGLPGRPRLFEVEQKVRLANRSRGSSGLSSSAALLTADSRRAIDYIVAPPRMQLYVDYSERIREVYHRFIAPEDIHVYSIDEVFIDVTPYLATYRLSPHDLAMRIIRAVLAETGITATAGIGTNMYLAKVAMDIVAKKMPPDSDGVRIAELDEFSYRRLLWNHRPLTDFWRVGRGTAAALEEAGISTMGELARCSLKCEDWFFSRFGVNAELLIDHAWGYEPVTMPLVKSYRPSTRSISTGQVLHSPYPAAHARNVLLEMTDAVSLRLIDHRLVTSQLTLTVGYDTASLTDPAISASYRGPVRTDHYGRLVPVHAHGTANLPSPTSSASILLDHIGTLFDRIINPGLLVRRLTISVNNLVPERSLSVPAPSRPVQLDLFTDYDAIRRREEAERKRLLRERRRQEAVLRIKKKFGKNAILRGLNYAEGATQRDRNSQIGGHKA